MNLHAVVDGARVSLAWNAVPGVDGYVIEAGTAPGLSDVGSAATGAPSVVADGVTSGIYYVRVRAVAAGAISGPSGEIVVAVP